MGKWADMSRAQRAGILCNDGDFRRFVGTVDRGGGTFAALPQEAAAYVRRFCHVHSRRELNTDDRAAERFDALHLAFRSWQTHRHRSEG